MPRYASTAHRIRANITVDDFGCWNWRRLLPTGYSNVEYVVDGRPRSSGGHRVAYQALVGPIPDGLQLDHLCRNRGCVNPGHLEPVTARENTLRSAAPSAVNAAKTHCVNGHPYDAANTLYGVNQRRCRACMAAEDQRARLDAAATARRNARARTRRRRGLSPGDPLHGTQNGYVNYGCRCDDCRAANGASASERRRARLAREAAE